MSSLKEIKGRIASVRNTQKITSAMRMVSSAKLHHAQGMTERFLRYRESLQSIVESLGGFQSAESSADSARSVVLIPVSSNSGLCGAFNSNIAKATFVRVEELESKGKRVRLLPIGKKIAHELQKKGYDCNLGYFNLLDNIEKKGVFAEVAFLVEYAVQLWQSGEADRVEFIYHHFRSMGSQVITSTALSLEAPVPQAKEDERWLTEPGAEELLGGLFPRLLNAQTYGVLLDSLTSEHAARMLAMQTADDNASDLIRELTLVYNKTRQQSITNELMDIMSGQAGKQ